jgi:hypothetical protein
VGSAFLIQEVDEIGFCTTTVVIQWHVLAILGEEFDGWESTDIIFLGQICILLCIAIDVCNNALFKTLHSWQT